MYGAPIEKIVIFLNLLFNLYLKSKEIKKRKNVISIKMFKNEFFLLNS